MAFTSSKSLVLFLALNLLFFAIASACGGGCGSRPITPYPGTGGSGGGSPSTPGGGGGGGGSGGACPIDALKLGVCANVLKDLLNLNIGTPPKTPCCPLIQGLVDAEAAICLCTAIKANVLGINLNIPVSLSLLVNYCGRTIPRGFQCP